MRQRVTNPGTKESSEAAPLSPFLDFFSCPKNAVLRDQRCESPAPMPADALFDQVQHRAEVVRWQAHGEV